MQDEPQRHGGTEVFCEWENRRNGDGELSLRAPHPGAGILAARNPVQSLRARSFGRGNLLASKARLLHSVRNDRLLCRESFLGVNCHCEPLIPALGFFLQETLCSRCEPGRSGAAISWLQKRDCFTPFAMTDSFVERVS